MQLLETRLNVALKDGDTFVTIDLYTSHGQGLVAKVSQHARTMHWHVLAVWSNKVNTFILFRYRAP